MLASRVGRAICVHCGFERTRVESACPACGHRPYGEGLVVAWLLSSEHLDDDELDEVQTRVRHGEPVHPSRRLLMAARRGLGMHLSTDPGLTWSEGAGILAANVLLTPLGGWVLALWWAGARPRAALQAAALSLPVTAFATGWVLFQLL